MRTIKVDSANPYLIKIGKNVLPILGAECKKVLPRAEKILVVADSNVAPLYLKTVSESLEKEGFSVCSAVFPAGEGSKNIRTYADLVGAAAKHGLCRDDAIVALGGGVTGDLAGFAAASYMRGIRYVQVPTTLLAAIDSSIGGKTGFDLAEGKNLVGAFHQPALVFFDVNTLNTLPKNEFTNGLGEGVKYAVLKGGRIAEILNDGLDQNDLEEFCALCAECKADVVSRDEKESGIRQLLNLGHTLAHAEEKLSGYVAPHGECVAAGIKAMALSSYKNGILSFADLNSIIKMLENCGLTKEFSSKKDELVSAAANDKKMHGKTLNVVEIVKIGDCRVRKMTLEEFGEYVK